MHELGIIQGRLLPMINNRIQAFPGDGWEREFFFAQEIGFNSIELTIEMASYSLHPIRSPEGREKLNDIKNKTNVVLAGLCCDVFMECPITSSDPKIYAQADQMMETIINDSANLGLAMIEVPLMGDNTIKDVDDRLRARIILEKHLPLAQAVGVDIILESDLNPIELKAFLDDINHPSLGINYDSGNSTWLGYDPNEEIPYYASYIRNVHIKDCTPKDYSLPLGEGKTDFDAVFKHLSDNNYKGDFILQAARQKDNIQAGKDYFTFTKTLIKKWFNNYDKMDKVQS
jgi:hexulose-6-phosphate isomerase